MRAVLVRARHGWRSCATHAASCSAPSMKSARIRAAASNVSTSSMSACNRIHSRAGGAPEASEAMIPALPRELLGAARQREC